VHSIDFAKLQHDHDRTVDKDHGRLEIRDCWTIADPRYVDDLRQGRKWKSLRSVAQVQLERRIGEQVTRDTRYYISSIRATPNRLRTRCGCIGVWM